MSDCIFCNIANHEDLQSERILFEDSDYVALLVSHPIINGHCIVFPKGHASQLKEMPRMGTLLQVTNDWAEQITATLGAKAYTLKLNNNLFKLEDHPLHVGHVHMHIIPRYTSTDELIDDPREEDDDYFKRTLALFK